MFRRPLRTKTLLLILLGFLVLLAGIAYAIPGVRDRIQWRISEIRAEIKYALNPPGEAIFVPEEQALLEEIVQSTLQAMAPTAPPTATQASSTLTPFPTIEPTVTATPIPQFISLEGVRYEHQHNRWNYCSPANLSMALTFWGWDGDRDVVASYLKPDDRDKNVLPWEMEDFVDNQVSGLRALVRSGGEVSLLRRLVAAGFPVVAEKGYYEYDYRGVYGWLGHFQFVTGYDEAKGVLIVQDTYIDDGQNHEFSYAEFIDGWRSFNYLFLVVYPEEREAELLHLMGPWADPAWAFSHALEIAQAEAQQLTSIDEFLAWFNIGASHVGLQQYVDAAYAFDYAFSLYANLGGDSMRPYRLMWYQTGPYWAYYYSGRYQDVVDLANTTLYETISDPVLEESLYWRGLGLEALGDLDGAISDWYAALAIHPGWQPAVYQLQRVGALP